MRPEATIAQISDKVATWTKLLLRTSYFLWLAATDWRVPIAARGVAAAGVAYVVSPIDLIPDEIPVIGELDDALVAAVALILAKRLIPAPLFAELRAEAAGQFPSGPWEGAQADLARGLVFTLTAAMASRFMIYGIGYAARWFAGDTVSMVQAFCRWDCIWYAGILRDGYASAPPESWIGEVNWAFFPLLPLLARFVWNLTPVGPELALLMTGNLMFLLAAVAIYVYGRERFDEASARALVLVTVFSPYSIYFSAGYTEALFLLMTALAFLLWGRKQFLLAGLAAAAASASRLVGAFLAIPFAIWALQDGLLQRFWRFRERNLRMLNAILLAPLGLALFMGYLYLQTGDALAPIDAQAAAWGMVPGNPFQVLLDAWRAPEKLLIYFAAVTTLGLGLAFYLAIRKCLAEAAFMLAGILAPLSAMTWSMPRYIFGLLPTYIALTLLMRDLRIPLPLTMGVLVALNGLVVVIWMGNLEWTRLEDALM